MKFKMRALHYSPAGNTMRMAQEIAKVQQCNSDKIPPAYPTEALKLLFIGVELKGSSNSKEVLALVQDLTTDRTKNVAFFATSSGSFAAIDELKKIVTSKGINVAGTTYECTVKGGLFKKGAVSDSDVKGAVDWANKLVDSM